MFSRRTGSDDTLPPRLEERLSRIEAERNRRLPQRGHVRS
jgi:hypothetical protein